MTSAREVGGSSCESLFHGAGGEEDARNPFDIPKTWRGGEGVEELQRLCPPLPPLYIWSTHVLIRLIACFFMYHHLLSSENRCFLWWQVLLGSDS